MTKESVTKVENMEWLDGHYTGEVSDGVPHGQGEFDRNQPVEYHPGWKGSDDDETDESESDEYIGQGRLDEIDYSVNHYSYSWGNCSKYAGEFKQGHPDGEGTLTIMDGSTYVGQFKDGKWHGEGTWTHPDGDECSGQWKEGRLHGQARWKQGVVSENEDRQREPDEYVGEFKDGLRHGKGTSTNDWGGDLFGYKYVGDWEDDHEDGHGVITYSDRVYEGEVFVRSPYGHGLMTYEDGSSFEGKWVQDVDDDESQKWEGTETDKDGNITATYVEGERIEKIVPFNDAQASAEEHENFNAPGLDHIATLTKGDLIWVTWVGEDDESTGERFWIKVVENRESEIKGTVENELTEAPYEYVEEVVIPHNCVYDYIRSDAVAAYREVFDEFINRESSLVIYAVSENSTEGALRSERVMTVLRLAEKLTATYPTDINAHVESSGGWTDLGVLESGDALLTPSTADISTSNLEGGSVEVQHAETQEKFWIKVVRIDASTGILYGLVKKEFAKAGLSRWQPVQCHVFQIWDAIFPRAKESLNLADGSTYIGEVSDGFPDGEGVWTLTDGTEYVGESKHGNWEGFGTETDPNGFTYTGEWENDKRHGQGVLSGKDKDDGRPMALSGEFKDGLPIGQVTEVRPDGSIYVGGVGPKDEGVCKEGRGTWTFLDGAEYVGEFRDDNVNGQGTWTYPDGHMYVGQLKDGRFHGHGTMTYVGGSMYVGEWEDQSRHGQGEQTYESGNKFAGEWKDEYPWKGTVIDEDGVPIATYLKGVRSDDSFDSKTRKKWSNFVSSAVSDVMESQGIMSKEYGLGDNFYERWWLDQETGSMTFIHNDLPGVIAKIQIIGSVSTGKNDWLWSWANTTILDQAKDQMRVVKEYGDKEGYTPLTTRLIEDEEDIEQLGWQLVSVAHRLLDAKGAYRAPDKRGAGFVIFTDIQKTGHFRWPADAKKGGDKAKNGAGTETYPDGSKYVGEFKDDLFHGQGTMSYANATLISQMKVSKYVGEFKEGLFHGHGTLVLTDGTQYAGDWKEGKRHGHGTVTDELFKCAGDFKDDELQGEGTYTFLDGTNADVVTITDSEFLAESVGGFYTGEASDGVPNGRGIADAFMSRYVGEWKDGLKHGWGTEDSTARHFDMLSYLSEEEGMPLPEHVRLSGESKYVGEWREGKKHGQGTETSLLDGTKYVGQFEDHEFHGEGVKTFPEGEKEVGEFVEGKLYAGFFYDQSGVATTVLFGMKGTYAGEMTDGVPSGQGTFTTEDLSSDSGGGKYVGEFKYGNFCGQGTLNFSNGDKYVGEFKDGRYNGQGTQTLSERSTYSGEWKDHQPHGQGTWTDLEEGWEYAGEWREGKKHGHGTEKDGGFETVGEWKDGLREGQGTEIWTASDSDLSSTYVGEFKDDRYHGQGTETWNTGREYLGQWKEGMKHGQGTQTVLDVHEPSDDDEETEPVTEVIKFVGEWREDKEWNGTLSVDDGRVLSTYSEGVETEK